ncbi:MAG: hypothetical protein ACK47F_01640 [Flavobacteriales bacterium]|jgi:ABC-type molybdate transport system ATPase subunit
MEKKTRRKKKDLDIDLKVNNADVSIERNETGTTIEVDSDVVDVTYHKDQEGNVKIDVEIDDKVIYEFVSNGASKHMPKGAIFKVSGAMLKLFVKRGFGKLKK